MIPHSSDPTPNPALSSVQAKSCHRTVLDFCSCRIWKSSGVASYDVHPLFANEYGQYAVDMYQIRVLCGD